MDHVLLAGEKKRSMSRHSSSIDKINNKYKSIDLKAKLDMYKCKGPYYELHAHGYTLLLDTMTHCRCQ